MSELKKKSRAFQVLLNAHIARRQTRKKIYGIEKEWVFKQFTLCMQTMRIFMISGKQKKERLRRTIGARRFEDGERESECDRETELNRKKIIFGVRECVLWASSSSFISVLMVFNSSQKEEKLRRSTKKRVIWFFPKISIGKRAPNTPIHLFHRPFFRCSHTVSQSACISLSLLTILFRHHANRLFVSVSLLPVRCVCVCVFSLKRQKAMNGGKKT